ncbi:MAG: hypothetical protein RTV41_01085 [Candidatus Thorarchaeota archaeon]
MAMDIWGLGGAWTPITFAAEFVFRMRKEKDRIISGIPSTRQAIAIPKFLTARFHRLNRLIPEDYVQASVFTTPIVDQELARQIAMAILFPQREQMPLKSAKAVAAKAGTPADHLQSPGAMTGIDEIMKEMSILGDMTGGAAVPEDIDAAIAQELSDMQKTLDFMERVMYEDSVEARAYRDLMETRGGPEIILRFGLSTMQELGDFLKENVISELNSLSPLDVSASCHLGWGDEILNGSSSPWERIATLYGMGKHNEFETELSSLMQADTSTAAISLKYLREVEFPHTRIKTLVDQLVGKSDNLWDIETLSDALGEMPTFNHQKVMEESMDDIARAFRAATSLENRAGQPIRTEMFQVFDRRVTQSGTRPTIDELATCATDTPGWYDMADKIIDEMIKEAE